MDKTKFEITYDIVKLYPYKTELFKHIYGDELFILYNNGHVERGRLDKVIFGVIGIRIASGNILRILKKSHFKIEGIRLFTYYPNIKIKRGPKIINYEEGYI